MKLRGDSGLQSRKTAKKLILCSIFIYSQQALKKVITKYHSPIMSIYQVQSPLNDHFLLTSANVFSGFLKTSLQLGQWLLTVPCDVPVRFVPFLRHLKAYKLGSAIKLWRYNICGHKYKIFCTLFVRNICTL